MRSSIRRGTVIYLTVSAHKRLLPEDKSNAFGKRPFLVVQTDFLNKTSGLTVVVAMSSVPPGNGMKSVGMDIFLPKGDGLANCDSWADCSSLHTVRERDIFNEFRGSYCDVEGVMEDVDRALRLTLDLDPEGHYPNNPV
jgi:mRNA-degrading endonuclease toxin of MazEF toxin-antitoxin module